MSNYEALREALAPTVEWRVADPKDGSYCMSFDAWRGEQEAHAWLDDHRRRFPNSVHAGYEVRRVEILRDWQRDAIALLADIDRVTAERDALAKDAERYRWLRDIGDATWRPFRLRDGCSAAMVDTAIDAAIAAMREGK